MKINIHAPGYYSVGRERVANDLGVSAQGDTVTMSCAFVDSSQAGRVRCVDIIFTRADAETDPMFAALVRRLTDLLPRGVDDE